MQICYNLQRVYSGLREGVFLSAARRSADGFFLRSRCHWLNVFNTLGKVHHGMLPI